MPDKTLSKTLGRAKVLEENRWTKRYMQREWDKVVDAVAAGCDGPARAFVQGGYNWDNLPLQLIPQVPGLAERMLRRKAEVDAEAEAAMPRQMTEAESRDYYLDHVEEVLLAKIDRGDALSDDEISDFLDELPHYADEYGDNRRWSRGVTTYLRTRDGRFFRVTWDQGLTESQSDSYLDQPVEVTLREEEVPVVAVRRTWTETATGRQTHSMAYPD